VAISKVFSGFNSCWKQLPIPTKRLAPLRSRMKPPLTGKTAQ